MIHCCIDWTLSLSSPLPPSFMSSFPINTAHGQGQSIHLIAYNCRHYRLHRHHHSCRLFPSISLLSTSIISIASFTRVVFFHRYYCSNNTIHVCFHLCSTLTQFQRLQQFRYCFTPFPPSDTAYFSVESCLRCIYFHKKLGHNACIVFLCLIVLSLKY